MTIKQASCGQRLIYENNCPQITQQDIICFPTKETTSNGPFSNYSGAPNDGFLPHNSENTFQAIQSTFISLEMHCNRRYRFESVQSRLRGRRRKGRWREKSGEKGREPLANSPQSPFPFSIPPYPLPFSKPATRASLVILGQLKSFRYYKGFSIIFPTILGAILSFTKVRILSDSKM